MDKDLLKALEKEAHLNGLTKKEYEEIVEAVDKLLDDAVANSRYMKLGKNPAEWHA